MPVAAGTWSAGDWPFRSAHGKLHIGSSRSALRVPQTTPIWIMRRCRCFPRQCPLTLERHGHINDELPSAGAHLRAHLSGLVHRLAARRGENNPWESYDNSTNSPVRIDLLQDGVHGPQFVTAISASTPDDGEFIWIPGNSGVNFDTPGLRIQVAYVGDPSIMDRGQESLTVPDNSTTFFVDDASDANDEYTLGAIGSNRNTGKRADAPKPHPVNLLRAYDLPAGALVSIDTGAYPLFDAIRISGTTDLGLGTEEGFTLRGPTDIAKHVTINWIYSDGHPQALIELNDADFMTLRNLDVTGSQRGLWVTAGSDNFTASSITARNQTLDGIDITPINSGANFVGLVAENAGRDGIVITGPFATLSDGAQRTTSAGAFFLPVLAMHASKRWRPLEIKTVSM